MIESIEQFLSFKRLNNFQLLILNNIADLLNQINPKDLSEHSFVEEKENRITISLVHILDTDTIVSLNVLKDYVTIWYSECEIHFDNDHDFDICNFKNVYHNCLLGNYITKNYYYKDRMLLSSTELVNCNIKSCTSHKILFYRFYFWLYEKRIIFKEITYKSFISVNK